MTEIALKPDDFAAAVLQEVHDFHGFLADWFSGRAVAGSEALAERLQGFDPGLQYIMPSGAVGDGATVETMLADAHGVAPAIEIEVRNAAVRRADAASVLVTYEEHQTGGNDDTSRLTTALFVPKPDAPNGVGWFHVHEVWLVSS